MEQDLKALKAGLAQNMRALRLAQGMSQEQLADVAGIDRTWVGKLERVRANPSLGTLLKLAIALNVKPGQLLDGNY